MTPVVVPLASRFTCGKDPSVHVRRVVLVYSFAIVSVVCAASCQETPPIDADDASIISSAAPEAGADASAPDASARRPTIRHYLARTDERCEVYSVDGDRVSPGERTPCPQDLEVGERIRIAGKTCLREGRKERSRPVVCPAALLYAYERLHPRPDAGNGASKP